ncbi:YheE family protein [Halalkalibacterium ligniniphilum]|uniref:YheE family protein n=1 Tax=Halalkalibacterium ligniniphilum TaxID=1134413 RepID=UPI0003495ADD|nr:YheE family protein [Halalkalibacterium ligniniphilum]
MISHFQWKERRNNLVRREWTFSFFHAGTYYTGIYFKDGSITWNQPDPATEQQPLFESQIHDLMLYHVYEGPF